MRSSSKHPAWPTSASSLSCPTNHLLPCPGSCRQTMATPEPTTRARCRRTVPPGRQLDGRGRNSPVQDHHLTLGSVRALAPKPLFDSPGVCWQRCSAKIGGRYAGQIVPRTDTGNTPRHGSTLGTIGAWHWRSPSGGPDGRAQIVELPASAFSAVAMQCTVRDSGSSITKAVQEPPGVAGLQLRPPLRFLEQSKGTEGTADQLCSRAIACSSAGQRLVGRRIATCSGCSSTAR